MLRCASSRSSSGMFWCTDTMNSAACVHASGSDQSGPSSTSPAAAARGAWRKPRRKGCAYAGAPMHLAHARGGGGVRTHGRQGSARARACGGAPVSASTLETCGDIVKGWSAAAAFAAATPSGPGAPRAAACKSSPGAAAGGVAAVAAASGAGAAGGRKANMSIRRFSRPRRGHSGAPARTRDRTLVNIT
jgi:hypothetical protein